MTRTLCLRSLTSSSRTASSSFLSSYVRSLVLYRVVSLSITVEQPSVHGRMIHELIKGPPGDAVYRYLPYGPFPELEQFLTWVETMIRRDPASLLFVMVDKTWSLAAGTAQLNGAASKSTLPPPTPLAGMLAYRTSSVDTLHIEIGCACPLSPLDGLSCSKA